MKKQRKKRKPTLYSRVLWGILTTLGLVFVIGLPIGIQAIIKYGGAGINMALGTSNFKIIDDPDAQPEYFFESSYDYLSRDKKYEKSSADKLFEEDNKAIYRAELEGATLLWNKADALPLSGSEYVNLLSHSSVDLVKGGSGSGYVITTAHHDTTLDISTNMKTAFTSKGFTINQTLWDFYATGAASGYKRTSPETNCKPWQKWFVNEVPWNVYTNNNIPNSFTVTGKDSIAIITISRTGGEYSDLHYNHESTTDFVGQNDTPGAQKENTSENNGYLGLTQEEKDLFSHVVEYKNSGTFKKVIVLLNTGNPLRFKDLTTYYSGIDACMWIGQPGSYGINAVVDLLKGKDSAGNDAVPSGHLVDTFMYDLNSAPASYNDGNYRYQGDLSPLYNPNSNYYNTYSVYKEGIYIGYRYYETRYEDTILGAGGASSPAGAVNSAGNWTYQEEVAFPFGYGDSYTSFEYSNFVVNEVNDHYEVNVDVTNVGDYAAKEAVQVYLQKPYTDHDKTYHLEKSAVELVGYAKTKKLAKNETTSLTINVKKEEFKTYDHNDKQTYILEAGDYHLTIAPSAHDALNNILNKKGYTSNLYETSYQNYTRRNQTNTRSISFVHTINIIEDDYVTYSISTQTGTPIVNRLDLGDLNKYEHSGGQTTTYVSRANWADTFPTTHEVLTMNADLAKDIRPDVAPDPTGYEMPNYNTFTSHGTTPNVAAGDVIAYQFMEAPLDPEKASAEEKAKTYEDGDYVKHWNTMWDKLLDQMSFEEQALMAANAYHQMFGATSINLPASKQENGPVGITKRKESSMAIPDPKIKYYYYVAYPSAQVVAATMNDEIALDIGNHKSEDMLYLGYNGIYGPGVNMHRNPYSGRAYEYPSEDPFLAGTIEYHESIGIESKGCLAYAKHFVMNDSETNRAHVAVWNNEQATREIYLKAFEICFSNNGAHATMNGFNRIGPKWNGACYEVQTEILRNEWGWEGINISDWRNQGQVSMSHVQGIMAGTNSFDGNDDASAYEPYQNNAAVCQALRKSTKYIIYNIVRTNAMNGITLGSRVIAITPWWQAALYMINNVFIVLFAMSAFMLAVSIAVPIINKGKQPPAPKVKVVKEKVPLKIRWQKLSKPVKILIPTGSLLLVVGILLATILPFALKEGGGGGSQIPSWITPDEEDPPIPEVVIDTGDKVDNIVEIEKTSISATTVGENHLCAATSYAFNSALSNNFAIKSIASDSTFSFSFNSDKPYAGVDLDIAIASYQEAGTYQDIPLSEALTVTLNNTIIDNEEAIPASNAAERIGDSYELNFQIVTLSITLALGENNVILTAGDKFTALDYVSIKTSATISGITSIDPSLNSKVTVPIAPKTTSEGQVKVECAHTGCSHSENYVLGQISESNGYSKINNDLYRINYLGNQIDFTPSTENKIIGSAHIKNKSYTLKNGKDFFNAANWDYSWNNASYAQGFFYDKSTLLNGEGNIVFEKTTEISKSGDSTSGFTTNGLYQVGRISALYADNSHSFLEKYSTAQGALYLGKTFAYTLTMRIDKSSAYNTGAYAFVIGLNGLTYTNSKYTNDSSVAGIFAHFRNSGACWTVIGANADSSNAKAAVYKVPTEAMTTANNGFIDYSKDNVFRFEMTRIDAELFKLSMYGNGVKIMLTNPTTASQEVTIDDVTYNQLDYRYTQDGDLYIRQTEEVQYQWGKYLSISPGVGVSVTIKGLTVEEI